MSSKGLAYWANAAQSPETFVTAAVALVKHPRFAEAARRTALNAVHRHTEQNFADFPSYDIFRLYYALFLVYLDLTGELTRARIEKFYVEMGYASAGRVASTLRRLEKMGHVALDPVQADRRSRRYHPTPALIEIFAAVHIGELETLALLEPEAAEVARNFHDPAGFRAYVIGFGNGIAGAVRSRRDNAITHFGDRNGGMAALFETMVTGEEGDEFPPKGPLRISLAGLAKRLRVSRNHIFRLFHDAEVKGLLRRDVDKGLVWLEDGLRFEIALFIAFVYAGLAACCFRARTARQEAARAGNTLRQG